MGDILVRSYHGCSSSLSVNLTFSRWSFQAKKDLARVEGAGSSGEDNSDVYMSDDEDMLNNVPSKEDDSDLDSEEERSR